MIRQYLRTFLLASAGGAAVCLAPGAMAQTSGPDAGRDTVVIVGTTIEETQPQELAKYGSDLSTVTTEEIRNQGFVDASQVLQMEVPGLFLAPRGGPFSYLDISLQGSRTQDMLFLVDGVRINNRLYSGTITDTLPSAMIERIEVLKGGQSLFYGTQAGAGVINVVTRGYTDAFNGQATIGGDTNNSLHLDAYVRGKAGAGNYVLYASQDKSDGFPAYDVVQPSATDRDRSYDVNSIGAKYRLELTQRLSVDARYHHTDARLDYPGARLTAYSKNERDEDIASLGVNLDASDMLRFQVKGYWHDWDSNYTTINNRLPLGSGQVVLDDQTFWGYEDKGINAIAEITPGGPFEYVVGYDFQQYSGRDDVLLIAEQEEDVHAVFGQLRSSDDLIKNGAFALGVRYNETGGTSKTVWNASGRYDFTGWLYGQANVGTSFLLPTAEQLYAVDPFSTLGRADLEAEESENLNVSLGGEQSPAVGPALGWQATYFARNISNLIGFADFVSLAEFDALYPNLQVDPDPSTPVNEFFLNGYYTNVGGEVEVRGFELLGTADFGNGLTAVASYTHTDTKMEGSANQLARIPTDFAKVSGSYNAGRWGADLSLLWTGEQRSNVAGFGSQNYGDYVVVDLAAHMFLDAEETHKLTARIANLFDEDYATRVSSTLIDGSTQRFLFANRGQPQTFHLAYSYAF
ncbi:TonB-dependent receptor plug domain-containing protein [bacterium]|nr:TonB-dependent receptor plug domain-containing protein [bacterium]